MKKILVRALVLSAISLVSDRLGLLPLVAEPIAGAHSVAGALDPSSCATANPPSWCAGSDLGAWINAAEAYLPGNGVTPAGCGTIQLSSQVLYTFKTPIVKPRCTLIDLNQSTLLWVGSSADAIIVADTGCAAPPNVGGIKNGRIFGGTGIKISRSNGIFLGGDPSGNIFSPDGCGNNQSFYDLAVQNFTDDFVVGNNAFQDTWIAGTIALSGRAGIHFIGGVKNTGENFSLHGTSFINNQGQDILVDSRSFAEINTNGASFDYAVGDSIVSMGKLFLNASTTHFERAAHGKFINCSGCSINVDGGVMYLMGDANADDAFGVFKGRGDRASFVGVDWANIGKSPIRQFFFWNDNSRTGSLYILNYRQFLGQSAINEVPAYRGAPPGNFIDSRVGNGIRSQAYGQDVSAEDGMQAGSLDAVGHATCWKPGGRLGYCSSAVGGDGTCACH